MSGREGGTQVCESPNQLARAQLLALPLATTAHSSLNDRFKTSRLGGEGVLCCEMTSSSQTWRHLPLKVQVQNRSLVFT